MAKGGQAEAKFAYGPFGESGAAGSYPWRFTGQRLNGWTGLYHFKARAYSPTLGRFLQADPIGYGDGPNIYIYVGNDPINSIDPTGEATVVAGCAVGGGVGLALGGVTAIPGCVVGAAVTAAGTVVVAVGVWIVGNESHKDAQEKSKVGPQGKKLIEDLVGEKKPERGKPIQVDGDAEGVTGEEIADKAAGIEGAKEEWKQSKAGDVRVVRLPDGTVVVHRPNSTSDGRPTVEVQAGGRKRVEVRVSDKPVRPRRKGSND